jgi:hypothetical protein
MAFPDAFRRAFQLRCRPFFPLIALLVSAGSGSRSAHAAPPKPRPPGVVIAHSPAVTRQYLGSPSIVRLPDGVWLVSHDFFGPGSTSDQVHVHASGDNGLTWQRRSEIRGAFWSSLFFHRDSLYLLGTARQDGDLVIRRSTDSGHTWSEPRDAQSGLLRNDARYHCAPMPVIEHNGRLWRAFEDVMGPGGWGSNFRSFMLSAPVDADLLIATNWIASNRLGRDPGWLDGRFGGWLEGNAVVAPDGRLVNILRADVRDPDERAAVINISADGTRATFDPASGFIGFPGGCKKFTIRQDPRDATYWSLSNFIPPDQRGGNVERTRNTLALVHSSDLIQWEVRSLLLHHPDRDHHGFQYADWQFDGEDLVAAVRTASDDDHGGAHGSHDANYITFHRWAGFRDRVDQPLPTPVDATSGGVRPNWPPLRLSDTVQLTVAGRPAFVFLPPKPLRTIPQPWVLYGPTLPGHPDEAERWMHEQFLAAGVAVAGVDVGEAQGSPASHEAFDALHATLVKAGFAERPSLLGRSRGGLHVTSWAIARPDLIAGIAGIYPVFDLTTYPGLVPAASAYGLTPETFSSRLAELNPVARIATLAHARIPAFLIHGDVDTVVPLRENSAAFVRAYRNAGVESLARLVVLPGQGHNMYEGFFHSQELVDFVIQTARTGLSVSP